MVKIQFDARDPLQLKEMMRPPQFEGVSFYGKNREHFDDLVDKITTPLLPEDIFPLNNDLVTLLNLYTRIPLISENGSSRSSITILELIGLEQKMYRNGCYDNHDLELLRRDRSTLQKIVNAFYEQKIPKALRQSWLSLERYGSALLHGTIDIECGQLQPEVKQMLEAWATKNNKHIQFNNQVEREKAPLNLSQKDFQMTVEYKDLRMNRLKEFSSHKIYWLPWNTPCQVFVSLRDKPEGALVFIDSGNLCLPCYGMLKKPKDSELERFIALRNSDSTERSYIILEPTNAKLYLGESFGIQQVAYEDFIYPRNSGFIFYNAGRPEYATVTTGDRILHEKMGIILPKNLGR